MRKHTDITSRRIRRFLEHELAPLLRSRRTGMSASVYRPTSSDRPIPSLDALFVPIEPGYAWGPVWSDAWFRLQGAIPQGWSGPVVARIDCGAEAIVWEGQNPVQGIDANHPELPIVAAEGERHVEILVQATGMNPNVSCDPPPVDPPPTPFVFRGADLIAVDPELDALYHDAKVAGLIGAEQPRDGELYSRLLFALNDVVNTFAPNDQDTWARCRAILADALRAPADRRGHSIRAIGHAHIDTAWLWPLERTRWKCIHTFATALSLMDRYPEYRFVCSQAQQYAWVKELAPKLYNRIAAAVARGQWEIAGSMWVEADCNITGGESLVRQILYGKRYWMSEFGYETRDLWLPDVFGYSAALPQILRKAGVDYFLTQKISWNQTNRFPHHTFLWEGIDGTRIFTHFPPADTYNGDMSPSELVHSERRFLDHGRSPVSLYVYGYGDGGGGPTSEMLENAARIAQAEGMPLLSHSRVVDFFAEAESGARDLPVWVGELYLELHRGTYTTQAATKRANRKSESLLRDAEFLAAVGSVSGLDYPSAALERAWKLVLTNQFHDIIPGSSVREVYIDAARDYAAAQSLAGNAIDAAWDHLAKSISTLGMEHPVLVVRNYDDRAYGKLVEAPIPDSLHPTSVAYGSGAPEPAQVVQTASGRSVLFCEQTTEEGHGYTVYELGCDELDETNTISVSALAIDNGMVRAEFAPNGSIVRLYDRLHDREVIPRSARANELVLYEDRPLYWDAWDVDPYYEEKGVVLSGAADVEVVEQGPIRGAIRWTHHFGKSRIVQTVRIVRDSPRIDFHTVVDWHEDHRMLKAVFPVDVNSPRATYEIQFGNVERPTHYNTSWDTARFEVAAQRWMDLSEGGYGVALLNDSKYGCDVHGNTMRLTLLRSPKAPDPDADMGTHEFVYAILPHYGDFRRGGVIETAYHLNSPPRAGLIAPEQTGHLPPERTFLTVDREGVFIESVKKAEDSDALIVRLYEGYNSRGPARLSISLGIQRACVCDLLEREQTELPVSEGCVAFDVLPFEILTLKLVPLQAGA